jgi:hypothetical protein
VAPDTIGGFNRFLDDQQKAPGTASISLHQFDDQYETVLNGIDVKRAQPLTNATFVPRGNTALMDAIGRSIVDTGSRIERMPNHERPEKVVMVIVTDGQENASKEYNQAKVHEMITHQQDKYAWEFVFLGANQDAIKAATNLGMAAGNAMTYAHNAAGSTAAFAAVGSNLRMMRTGTKRSMSYSEAQRAEQLKAGLKNP